MAYTTNKGTKLMIGSTTGGETTWAEVSRLRNVPAIAMEEEKIEVTHHGSTTREYIPSGLADPGDYEFEMETDRANTVHKQIFTLRTSKEVVPWKLIYPDGLTYQFDASVLKITRADADPQSPDVIIDTVGLAISGEVKDISDEALS